MCLLIYLERRQLKWLFIAGLILGFGFYSYIASVVMMPLYLLLIYEKKERENWSPDDRRRVQALADIIRQAWRRQ